MLDDFEAGIMTSHWSMVVGGSIGNGCGTMLPVAYGKHLYFDGCGQRQAVSVELDLTRARCVADLSCMAYLQNDCERVASDHQLELSVL